jgi:hypothetical protein
MATSTKTPVQRTSGEKSSVEYLQQALQDIDHARERAGTELRDSLDSASGRVREAIADLRKRAEDQAAELERAFEDAAEETRREYGRRAIMAQRSPEALGEMSAAIRKRRTALTKQATGDAA